MRLFAHDLALARTIYGEQDKAPEMTIALPKDADSPAIGERIILDNKGRNGYGPPTAECEAEVVARAVVVRPDWATYRNPFAERQQESLL